MHMKVQGLLMQARFIEIRQVFTKKKRLNTFLTDLVFVFYPPYDVYLFGTVTISPIENAVTEVKTHQENDK